MEGATGVGRYFAALKVRRRGGCEVWVAPLGVYSYQKMGNSISRHKSPNVVTQVTRATSTRAARQDSNLPNTAKLTRAASTEAPAAASRYNASGVWGVREQGLE